MHVLVLSVASIDSWSIPRNCRSCGSGKAGGEGIAKGFEVTCAAKEQERRNDIWNIAKRIVR